MKVLISIVIGLVVAGCGKKEITKQCNFCLKSDLKKGAVICKHCGKHPEGVDIQNTFVEKGIRQELKKPYGELTKADLEKVTEFPPYWVNFSYKGMTAVPKWMENFTQLRKLELWSNRLRQIAHVKGLEKLTQLTHLYLGRNKLTDVKGLEQLTQLRSLWLAYNQLTDVKGLEKLTKLTNLNLSYNKLTNVKGLEKLTQLRGLGLGENQLTDVSSLEKLTQLRRLSLNGNQP